VRRLVVVGVLVISVAWLAFTAGPALGQGRPNGTVTATVQVQAAACIQISPTSFTYAPAGLSTTGAFITTLPNSTKPVVTSCSSGNQNFLARGGTATASGTSWDLASAFDCSAPEVNKYKHELKPAAGSYTPLTSSDATWETAIGMSATRTVDTRLMMPCTGSNGVGQTVSMPI